MGEELGEGGIGRRDLLKKSAVAGGLVWAAPVVFSATAGAAATVGFCTDCPDNRLFGLKSDNGSTATSLPLGTGGGGNCLTVTAVAPPSCFDGLYSITSSGSGDERVDTWTLQPSLQLCQAAAKTGTNSADDPDNDRCVVCPGEGCEPLDTDPPIVVETAPNGVTTVTLDVDKLSHTEVLFCYRGSPNECLEQNGS